MSRTPRIPSYTDIYHIVIRSVNQQIIFEDPQDYEKFLFLLRDCKKKYTFDIYAYCLMTNHVHIMLKCSPDDLTKIFHWHGTKFVTWYNRKYHRVGPLYQGRFKSSPIENIQHFLNAFRYIHNNPVKAGKCRFPDEHPWSSYNAYFGRTDPLVTTDYAEQLLGSREELQNMFKHAPFPEEGYDPLATYKHSQSITDENALILMQNLTGYKTTHDIQALNLTDRNKVIRKLAKNHIPGSQIARLCGLSKSTVYRITSAGTHAQAPVGTHAPVPESHTIPDNSPS